jgi:DNA invertase Pin-like site-specific DNA recombinase
MINAVAYVRMSSDKQEASPKQQREEIAKLTQRKADWAIALRLTGELVDRVDTHVTQRGLALALGMAAQKLHMI